MSVDCNDPSSNTNNSYECQNESFSNNEDKYLNTTISNTNM